MNSGTIFNHSLQGKMQRKNLIFIVLFCLLLTACGNSENPENTENTASTQTGQQTQSGTQDSQIDTGNQNGENNTGKLQNTHQNKIEEIKLSPNLTNTSPTFFPVSQCNQIIALYNCIISNAPIENQPIMQQALESSVKPRHLMPDHELRKVCEEISGDENYKKVEAHYSTGQIVPCIFES